MQKSNPLEKTSRISILPHDRNWQNIFADAAREVKKALGDNVITIHHIGSTSVPGLAGKPTIDIIAVVRDLFFQNLILENIGYEYRGGFNIPFRKCFTTRAANKNINLHVFEENDPEIELNLLFNLSLI